MGFLGVLDEGDIELAGNLSKPPVAVGLGTASDALLWLSFWFFSPKENLLRVVRLPQCWLGIISWITGPLRARFFRHRKNRRRRVPEAQRSMNDSPNLDPRLKKFIERVIIPNPSQNKLLTIIFLIV